MSFSKRKHYFPFIIYAFNSSLLREKFIQFKLKAEQSHINVIHTSLKTANQLKNCIVFIQFHFILVLFSHYTNIEGNRGTKSYLLLNEELILP